MGLQPMRNDGDQHSSRYVVERTDGADPQVSKATLRIETFASWRRRSNGAYFRLEPELIGQITMILSGGLATTLLELAPDATVVVDADGTIVFANARTEQTFGYSPAELTGLSVDTLLPPRLRAAHVAHRAQFSAAPKPRPMGRDLTLLGLHKNGREFPIEISLSPAPSEEGPLVVAAIRDATVRRDTERALIEANRAKSRLLAAASHDLRQPVQTLNLLNRAAVRHAGANAALRNVLDRQQLALDTMAALLTSVLDISKLDSGAVKPEIAACPLETVFDRLRSDYEPQATDKGLGLRVEPTAEGGLTDPELLRRLLGNLIANAIRYTLHGGIDVGCRRRGEKLEVVVRDTGIGIPADQTERIFEEFYQIDNGAQRPEGLGLGLSIVRRLALLLDASIRIDSETGVGTAFTVTLRRAELAQSHTLAGAVARGPEQRPRARRRRRARRGRSHGHAARARRIRGAGRELRARSARARGRGNT